MSRHLLISLGFVALGCGREAAPRDEHGHSHEEEAPHEHKFDPHHAAEDRPHCEDDVALSADALERYGISVEPAREMPLTARISAPGHLAFPESSLARVGSVVAGRVAELSVRSGDHVARGDTLIVVDSSALGEAQSEYLQKRTIAATAGPAVDLAKSALDRARELHERVQGIALSEVQRREAELRAAERDREVARSAEAAARNRLLLFGMAEEGIAELEKTGVVEPRLALRSPIEGKVVEIAATLGELVGPEKDRLVVVGDLRTLWAIAEVSESRLAEVSVGAPARVEVPALGRTAGEGRVAAVPTVLEASTRTAEVRIELENKDGTMLPGMYITVEIESSRGAGKTVLTVPDEAVMNIEGRPSVFVPIEPGGSVFCRHEIEIGAQVGGFVPVLSGLKPGELVVVAGTFRLKAERGKATAKHEH